MPASGVPQRLVQGGLRDAKRRAGHRDAERGEGRKRQREPLARLAHPVVGRHADAVENDIAQDMRRDDLVRPGDLIPGVPAGTKTSE